MTRAPAAAAARAYRHTEVRAVPPLRLRELRALALHALRGLPTTAWRHHPIGVAQAYLVEGDPEARLHVWHPDLVDPGYAGWRQVHDHRFALVSTVLAGSLAHEEFHITTAAPGDADVWRRWTVRHARAGAAPPELVAGDFRASVAAGEIGEGERYVFERFRFHRSAARGLAVSLVSKVNPSHLPAMLLAPAGMTPRHGFDRPDGARPDLRDYVARARNELACALAEDVDR